MATVDRVEQIVPYMDALLAMKLAMKTIKKRTPRRVRQGALV